MRGTGARLIAAQELTLGRDKRGASVEQPEMPRVGAWI